MTSNPSAEHVRLNRAIWDASADDYQAEHAPQLSVEPMKWGVWGIPESELRVLGDLAGRDVLELGCGAALWSLELARAGARPVGLDVSAGQLRFALEYQAAQDIRFPLLLSDAEQLPFADGSFDTVFCDYGAMTFANPYDTVPEVARVLRIGGSFAFSTVGIFMHLCQPDGAEHPTSELSMDYFGLHEIHYFEEAAESVEFQLPYGDWIRLFRANGFEVLDLIETRPQPNAESTYRSDVDREWARRWPMENIWKLRKTTS